MSASRSKDSKSAVPNPDHKPSKVEIFSHQPSFKIQQGATRHIPLIGSVYDHKFNGTIQVASNNKDNAPNTACPICFANQNPPVPVSLPKGANETIVTVVLTCTEYLPRLKYCFFSSCAASSRIA